MGRRLALAEGLRKAARIVTVILVPIIAFYLIFVGLQLASGEQGFLGLSFNILLLLLLGAGYLIAWRREGLGAALALAALAAFLTLGTVLHGFAAAFHSSPLVWPIALLAALLKEQSFDPMPPWIPVSAWALLLAPILFFAASWILRRESG